MEHPIVPDQGQPQGEDTLGRRRLLKVLAAAGGVTAASALLPGKWTKPTVRVGMLPAHAQITPTVVPTALPGTNDLEVSLSWTPGESDPERGYCPDNEDATDVNLYVVEPDGTRVYYRNPEGPTATLDFDNQLGLGPENITVPVGRAASGDYVIFVNYRCGSQGVTATVTVRVFAGTSREMSATFVRSLGGEGDEGCTMHYVGKVIFPGGTIEELSGTENWCTE